MAFDEFNRHSFKDVFRNIPYFRKEYDFTVFVLFSQEMGERRLINKVEGSQVIFKAPAISISCHQGLLQLGF